MGAQHTSGPWQSRDDVTTEGFVTIIANVDGEIIDGSHSYTYDTVAICEDEYGERLINVAANVRLITAAPDMLAALQELHLRTVIGTEGQRHDALNKAWAAIAKATGQ